VGYEVKLEGALMRVLTYYGIIAFAMFLIYSFVKGE
jgi:hypothetical protein